MVLAVVSLIDVVFLLLLYFLCTAKFGTSEEVFPLEIPAAASAEGSNPAAAPPLVVRVTDAAQGWLRIDGDWPQPRNEQELLTVLQDLRTGDSSMLAIDHSILIAPHPHAAWGNVVSTYNAVVRAGFTNIGFESSL